MLQASSGIHSVDRPSRPCTGWTSPAGPTAGGRPRWARLLVAGLACVLAAACTGTDGQETTETSHASAAPIQRDYWPTAGWQTAAPDEQGMDPAVLDDLDTMVPDLYPQVRSVLVVRHGYLVYERYWHGVDARDGQSSFSVTKSFISALVGIALVDGHLRSLDQTVEELLAPHLPPDADPRLRRVTVAQLLAMTSGLAGDDSSLGGDDRIWDRMFQSRDWVRHILGRRPESTPGESFAYSGANSHLLSAIVADTTGESTLAYACGKLFGPLGIGTDNGLEQVLRRWPPTRAEVAAYERAPVAWPRDPRATTWATASCGCPPATWPSSAICTSTAAAGMAPRWSRPTTCAPRPGRRATQQWVPGTTATTGG